MLVVDDYASAKGADGVAATIAEIDVFLATPTKGLLDRFVAQTGPGNLLIGDGDEAGRRWLSGVRDRLAHFTRKPS